MPRHRKTRRRGGAMSKTFEELLFNLEDEPSKSTLENVITELKASGDDVLESFARLFERELQKPLRARETMESRVREIIKRVVAVLQMHDKKRGGRRRKTTRRRK